MNPVSNVFGPIHLVAALMLIGAASLGPAGSASAATGDLAFDGCLANDSSEGCFDLPGAPLDAASQTAASPDGTSVYVTSQSGDSIAHFLRGPGGRLSYDACLNDDGTNGCVDLPGSPLDGAFGVSVSPDGRSVYVASHVDDSIAHFFRTPPEGQIVYDGCLNDSGADGCVDLPGEPLDGASGVATSADGKSVYVAAADGDSVSHFFRGGPDGQISYDGCLNNDGASGCVDLPGAPLNAAFALAVSPDGGSVYAASYGSNSIAHFFRTPPEGQIVYDGCLNNDGAHGCVPVPGAPLETAIGVAVSPDGKSVYATSFSSESLVRFGRVEPDGQIVYGGCLSSDGHGGCVDLPGAPLDGATGVTATADGQSVYVASQLSDSVAHFRRELAATPAADPPAGPAPGPPAEADTAAPGISSLELKNRRFRVGRASTPQVALKAPVGTKLRYALSEPATVAITIERQRSGKGAGTLTRAGTAGPNAMPFTGRVGRRELRPGSYRMRVVATDAAGNASTPATVRFRVVAEVEANAS